jgi:hypothetical protein
VTAPLNKFGGIYGLSTNAMPPQGDCFMASMLTVPDFTHRTSLYNLIPGVLRSSLADLPESILLLVAKARQYIVDLMSDIVMLWRESNRYGMYPANELAGISPAFVLKDALRQKT